MHKFKRKLSVEAKDPGLEVLVAEEGRDEGGTHIDEDQVEAVDKALPRGLLLKLSGVETV